MKSLIIKAIKLICYLIQKFFLIIIFIYQKIISKLLLPRCRFYPSCSEYAKIALTKHKLHIAIWLISKRLIKCHPGCSGGIDQVPDIIKK